MDGREGCEGLRRQWERRGRVESIKRIKAKERRELKGDLKKKEMNHHTKKMNNSSNIKILKTVIKKKLNIRSKLTLR